MTVKIKNSSNEYGGNNEEKDSNVMPGKIDEEKLKRNRTKNVDMAEKNFHRDLSSRENFSLLFQKTAELLSIKVLR